MLDHILGFIAGAIKTLFFTEKSKVETKSSPIPCANFPIKFAVAGAIIIKSVFSVNVIWGILPEEEFSLPSTGDYIPAEQFNKYNFNNINQVFAAMSRETKAFSGLCFDQIGDQGLKLKKSFNVAEDL